MKRGRQATPESSAGKNEGLRESSQEFLLAENPGVTFGPPQRL